MSLTKQRWIVSIVAALILVLGAYGVVQGRGGPAQAVAPAPQQQDPGIPTGAVMFFDLSACPAGWTEEVEARGRYLVGLPDGGALSETVGEALGDKEDRPVGQHTHEVDDQGHGHWVEDPGHGHAIAITDKGHLHGVSEHYHYIAYATGSGDTIEPAPQWNLRTFDDDGVYNYWWTTVAATEPSGLNIFANTTGIEATAPANTAGISVLMGTTGVTVADAGATAGTNAPYLQLLVCRKD